MSKRVRNMLLSLVALLAVGALVAVVLWMPSATPSEDTDTTTATTTAVQDIVIIDKTKNANGGAVQKPVVRVDIQNAQDTFAIITRDDTTMAVEAYRELLPDTTAITALCDTLSYMTALATTSADEDDSAYGLDKPLATVKTTYHDGSTATVYIGGESKGTLGYYCRLEGNDTLYIIDATVAQEHSGVSYVSALYSALPGIVFRTNIGVNGATGATGGT